MESTAADIDDVYDILNHSKDILYKFDISSLRYVYVTPSVENVLGYSAKEIIDGGFEFVNSLLHPEDRLKQNEIYKMLFDADEQQCEIPMEYRIRHKDGKTILISDYVSIIKGVGNSGCVIGNARDITKQKAVEEDLFVSEKRSSDLYKYARVGLFKASLEDGKLIECNDVFANHLGYDSVDECVNHFNFSEDYLSGDVLASLVTKLNNNSEINSVDAKIKLHNGTTKWFRFSGIPNNQLGCVECSAINITCEKILTPAEKRVLRYVLCGMTNSEIAYKISRSKRTIEDQRAHIMKKLHASNKVELTIKAMEHGFIEF